MEGVTMSRKKPLANSKYTKADVEAAVRNLVRKGLIIAQEDLDGKVVYLPIDRGPPSGPFELEVYRRGLGKDDSRS